MVKFFFCMIFTFCLSFSYLFFMKECRLIRLWLSSIMCVRLFSAPQDKLINKLLPIDVKSVYMNVYTRLTKSQHRYVQALTWILHLSLWHHHIAHSDEYRRCLQRNIRIFVHLFIHFMCVMCFSLFFCYSTFATEIKILESQTEIARLNPQVNDAIVEI